MKEAISFEDLSKFENEFDREPKNSVAMNAAVKNGVFNAAFNYESPRINLHSFSVEVESGDATDQKHSGRCWMFASLNVMRLEVMKKLNLKSMELSQSYPLFFDKLEKSNYFLENILETLDEPREGRLIDYLLHDLAGDGGQWDMFRSLVDKYGVVPKDIMPESEASSATQQLNKLLKVKLREYACTLRIKAAAGAAKSQLRREKEKMMSTIYRILCIALGKPPKTFTWETRDKDNKFVRVENVTPQQFFRKYVGWDLDDYVTVINAPTEDKPYERTYTVRCLGNVRGGKYPVKYLNLPVEELKALAVAQLKDNRIVWFGSDVGQFSERDHGFLTTDAYDLAGLLGTDFPMTKAQRLDYGESLMTHAMCITGVDLGRDGSPIRWKVENSWGKEPGKDGYYVMSDAWFNEFVYQILLDRKYLSVRQKKAFDQEPIVLEPWDPMGSLAD